HQHMPMFHNEHCVFAALLSKGKEATDCGRPCDRHALALRDWAGHEHPVKADVGCRNTVYNAVPQSASPYVRGRAGRPPNASWGPTGRSWRGAGTGNASGRTSGPPMCSGSPAGRSAAATHKVQLLYEIFEPFSHASWQNLTPPGTL